MGSAQPGDIRAGGAYVAIGARLDTLQRDLVVAEGMLLHWSKRMAGLGFRMGAIGAAIGAPLALGAKQAAVFESQMAEVLKVTDPRTAEVMGREVRRMAREMPLAHEQLANLTADAARFGVRGPRALTAFVEAAAKMGVATDLSAEQGGQALVKLSRLTQTNVEDVERLGSAINELSNNFATSSSEIVEGAIRGGAALNQLGLRNTEILGLSAGLNEASASARRAGTRLRRVAQELMDPRRLERIAEALGTNVQRLRAFRDRAPLQTIMMLAKRMRDGGVAAEELRSAISAQSQQALGALGQNFARVAGALRMSNEAFAEGTSLQREYNIFAGTTISRTVILANNVRDLAIEIGKAITFIKDLVDRATDFINRAREWVSENRAVINGLAKLSAGLIAAGAALLVLAGTLKIVSMLFAPIVAIPVAIWAMADALTETNLGFLDMVGNVRIGSKKIETWLTLAFLGWQKAWVEFRGRFDKDWNTLVAMMNTDSSAWGTLFLDVLDTINKFFRRVVQGWLNIMELFIRLVSEDFEWGFEVWNEDIDRDIENRQKNRWAELWDRHPDVAQQLDHDIREIDKRLAEQRRILDDAINAVNDADRKVADRQNRLPEALKDAMDKWKGLLPQIGGGMDWALRGGGPGGGAVSRGTFSTAALYGFGFAGPLERTADAVEQNVEINEEILDEVREWANEFE